MQFGRVRVLEDLRQRAREIAEVMRRVRGQGSRGSEDEVRVEVVVR